MRIIFLLNMLNALASQLHQLRGRVGRGTKEGHCLLLYMPTLSQLAKERLHILKTTQNGFELAERDLELRGAGDILGIKQSGIPSYKVASPILHRTLIEKAQKEAQTLLEGDPFLKSPRGQAARLLLYLFDQHTVLSYLRSA